MGNPVATPSGWLSGDMAMCASSAPVFARSDDSGAAGGGCMLSRPCDPFSGLQTANLPALSLPPAHDQGSPSNSASNPNASNASNSPSTTPDINPTVAMTEFLGGLPGDLPDRFLSRFLKMGISDLHALSKLSQAQLRDLVPPLGPYKHLSTELQKDWHCSKCGFVNYARYGNATCYRCTHPRTSSSASTMCKDADGSKISAMLHERELTRRAQDFARADAIREELRAMGVVWDDDMKTWRTPDGRCGRWGTPSHTVAAAGAAQGGHAIKLRGLPFRVRYGNATCYRCTHPRTSSSASTMCKDADGSKISAMLHERELTRRAQDFARADAIREELRAMGVVWDDDMKTWRTPDGRCGRWGTPSHTVAAAGAAQGGHAIKLRGLPFRIRYDDIRNFFALAGIDIMQYSVVLEKNADGRPSGVGYVKVATAEEQQQACAQLNHKHIPGYDRYAWVVESNETEYQAAKNSWAGTALSDAPSEGDSQSASQKLKEREEYRKLRQYDRADAIREQLREQGITFDDELRTWSDRNGNAGRWGLKTPLFSQTAASQSAGFHQPSTPALPPTFSGAPQNQSTLLHPSAMAMPAMTMPGAALQVPNLSNPNNLANMSVLAPAAPSLEMAGNVQIQDAPNAFFTAAPHHLQPVDMGTMQSLTSPFASNLSANTPQPPLLHPTTKLNLSTGTLTTMSLSPVNPRSAEDSQESQGSQGAAGGRSSNSSQSPGAPFSAHKAERKAGTSPFALCKEDEALFAASDEGANFAREFTLRTLLDYDREKKLTAHADILSESSSCSRPTSCNSENDRDVQSLNGHFDKRDRSWSPERSRVVRTAPDAPLPKGSSPQQLTLEYNFDTSGDLHSFNEAHVLGFDHFQSAAESAALENSSTESHHFILEPGRASFIESLKTCGVIASDPPSCSEESSPTQNDSASTTTSSRKADRFVDLNTLPTHPHTVVSRKTRPRVVTDFDAEDDVCAPSNNTWGMASILHICTTPTPTSAKSLKNLPHPYDAYLPGTPFKSDTPLASRLKTILDQVAETAAADETSEQGSTGREDEVEPDDADGPPPMTQDEIQALLQQYEDASKEAAWRKHELCIPL
eukprot:gene8767-13581_t